MPTIDVTDAPDRLLANKSVTPGHCLEYVSRAIRNGLPPLIWNGLDTALNCWNLACGDKHTSRDVPRGFPAFLGAKRGNNDGDVMLSIGGGKFAPTDYPGWGQVGICTLEQREAQTGRKYLGYAGEFLGYTLTSTTTAGVGTPITETQEEDDMTSIRLRGDGGSIAWTTLGTSFFWELPDPAYETLLNGWKLWDRTKDLNVPDNIYGFLKACAVNARGTVDTASIVAGVVAAITSNGGKVDGAAVASAVDAALADNFAAIPKAVLDAAVAQLNK